jgi:hypothetical protein
VAAGGWDSERSGGEKGTGVGSEHARRLVDDAARARSDLQRRGPEPELPVQARWLLSLQSTAGNRAVAGLVQRWHGSSAAPAIQRKAKITYQGETFDSAADSAKALASLKTALAEKKLLELLPSDLPDPESILADMFDASRNYGTFNLRYEADQLKLAGLIVQAHRARTAQKDTTKAGASPSNAFRVEPKSKQELQQTLVLWNAYYQYKMAQYRALREVQPEYYTTLSAKDPFKNFANVGSMIDMVASSISGMDAATIHQKVRVAVNPNAPEKIAAILIYSSRPSGKGPGYVADLLANPKSIKPDRKEGEYKQRKGSIKDPTVTGQGRAALPDASAQRGGGSGLLQHAVLESGKAGIKLAPLNDTTKATYLAMKFGDATFKETGDGHLVLEPGDIPAFAAKAQESGLKETIQDWLARWG